MWHRSSSGSTKAGLELTPPVLAKTTEPQTGGCHRLSSVQPYNCIYSSDLKLSIFILTYIPLVPIDEY